MMNAKGLLGTVSGTKEKEKKKQCYCSGEACLPFNVVFPNIPPVQHWKTHFPLKQGLNSCT